MHRLPAWLVAFAALLACLPLHAQFDPAVTEARLAAQREAMRRLGAMDGAWRGTATTELPGGAKRTIVQTERIGPFLDGSVKVIEGRGTDDEGRVVFHAFGVVSFDPDSGRYSLRSYAQSQRGDFAFEPTADGYRWEVPAGGATIRYTATIRGDELVEVGERIVPGQPPRRFFEMKLRRLGDSDWPAAGAVPPK